MTNVQSFTFYVAGMHCAACEVLLEENFREVEGVQAVQASLTQKVVMVQGIFPVPPAELARQLTARVQEHGYTLTVDQEGHTKRWREFYSAVPIALVVVVGFYLLQKSGLLTFTFAGAVNYSTAFMIGIVASLSTCLAVVGGLVLSLATNYSKGGETWKPQALFHVGRLVAFFVLGGVIGALGSSFQLGARGTFVLAVIAALVMFILGLNLLDLFHGIGRLQIAMPKIFAQGIHRLSRGTHGLLPILVGAVTFFLPCGFTQAMQIYTLTTGSFFNGALTMLTFALGTLPVLALLSFGAFRVGQKAWKGVFFKTAGLVVIVLALFNILTALAAIGFINPLFTL